MKRIKKKLTATVTEKDRQEGLEKGWNDDDMAKPGVYRVQRSRFTHKTQSGASKIKITIYLDEDILEHFKERAGQPDAAPYQTQINAALRQVVEGESSKVQRIEETILNDTRFLKELKAKLSKI